MPDTREHRGPHPQDGRLFAPATWRMLRRATGHLSWLLSHGYAERSALKLVGDRFQLVQRQRLAVLRSACSDQARRHRREKQLHGPDVAAEQIDIDGFNVLTSIEAALAGGVLLWGRDGCYRDLASMHGSYRRVAETASALQILGRTLSERQVAASRWLLDRPVSNSGRLATMIRHVASECDWPWSVELVNDPDRVLAASPYVVATADSAVLDHCTRWFNLSRTAIELDLPTARVIPLGIA